MPGPGKGVGVSEVIAAWEKGVAYVNADRSKWNDVLKTNNLLSPALLPTYKLPDFPTASVPGRRSTSCNCRT